MLNAEGGGGSRNDGGSTLGKRALFVPVLLGSNWHSSKERKWILRATLFSGDLYNLVSTIAQR